ncbi:thioredoxin-like domain-containing protein [Oscillatoria laete-virens NRMC-F 0139]|nr:thioredoxin-like domain-containing protein [Oscillatoria laete-virens]MDL5055368.1 thioredoxin-like domain-containing protein [Oscillatoria laete-virens NRMC-F 0139]
MRHPPYRLVFALSIMILGVLHSSLTGAIPERSLWPRLVTITKEVQATLIENGQEIGMAKLRAGKSYKLLDVDESGELLTVDVDGAQALIPVNQTDFTSKTAANAARLAPKEEPAPAPSTTVVTPEAVPPVEAESSPAPASPTNHQPLASVTRTLEGSLVHLQDGHLIPLNVSTLSGVKYYAIYYSAEWCPPCRKFTPSLVSTYRQLKKGHPELEFILSAGIAVQRTWSHI